MLKIFRALAGALALCVVLVGAASAQSPNRSDLFVVSGVRVDVTAPSAAAARDQAQDRAERIAFERLVRRLTPAEQFAQFGAPRLEGVAFDRLVSSIEIEEERRAGPRYIGRLRIAFSPDLVRMALRDAGYTVLETRGPPILVIPRLMGAAPEAEAAWRDSWSLGGFGQELTPIAVGGETLAGPPDWAAARDFAAAVGAAQAVYVTARIAGGAAVGEIVAVDSRGVRNLGQVTAPMAIGDGGLAVGFRQLADAANARIQAEWKSQLSQGAAERVRIAAQALYRTGPEWRRIKAGLVAASATIVSDVLVEAVAREGALVSFAYIGTPEQLAAELARRGVRLEGAPGAWILRADPAG